MHVMISNPSKRHYYSRHKIRVSETFNIRSKINHYVYLFDARVRCAESHSIYSLENKFKSLTYSVKRVFFYEMSLESKSSVLARPVFFFSLYSWRMNTFNPNTQNFSFRKGRCASIINPIKIYFGVICRKTFPNPEMHW